MVRYEHSRPGEMIPHGDQEIGTQRIAVVDHRITGDRSPLKRGAGWEYLNVCGDDYNRLAYAELLANKKGPTSTYSLIRAVGGLKNGDD